MSVTIVDIAKKANVSVSTVSRVLNDKPDVSSETLQRVRSAIKELKYSPSSVARGLVLKHSNIIGYIASDITNPSFPETARGVVVKAKEYGYSVMFFDANQDSKVEKEAIQLLRSKQVDGIILSFSEANRDELEKLKQERFPVVQIYRKSSRSAISTIAIDNVGSGFRATRYLLDAGHRRIAHLTTGSLTQSGYERMKGYGQALEEAGIALDEALIQTGVNTVEAGKECMNRLLDLEVRPTAVFASHDVLAIGAYEAILDRGLLIPGDISVLGHDNIELSRLVRPKLTTIDTFKYRLGEASVDLLVEEMSAHAPQNKEIVFSGELVVRDSVRVL
ncbi:MAG: LacI family DNA-binding transcriptional regulator [Sphaerochaeta sp.]|nr:LacI family DNA-binding transcriptional regulator [Sphaerochaeta sp.]